MNYIELINHYWSLREQGIITGCEGDLYLYLLHTSNKLNWKNPFNQSNRLICAYLNISEKSLIKYRNNLKQAGLIDFESGKALKQNTNYCIISSSSGSSSGSSLGSSLGSSSGSSLVENRSDNIKHKLNKTKQDFLLEKETKEKFSFRESLLDLSADEKLVDDWLLIRKNKKATNSETAFSMFFNEFKASKRPIDEVLKICIERDWKGFKAEWLKNKENNGTGAKKYNGSSSTEKKPYVFDLEEALEQTLFSNS